MKKITLLLVCLITFSSFAQKVDLDREYMNVSYVRLPAVPVLDASYRTYSVNVNSSYAASSTYPIDVVKDKILIEGFEKVNTGGTIDIQVQIGAVIIKNAQVTKREVVKKDKEGKVTSRTTYYRPVITYATDGNYYLKDHTDNPSTHSLGYTKTHKASEYNSYSQASKYLSNNRYSLKSKFSRDFVRGIAGRINSQMNYKYGYSQINEKVLLWILDSKKNPENAGHKKALADMKTSFGTMEYDLPIDNINAEAQSIIAYFESVIPKFPEVKKKKHRKMRYASYFNIAYMYYYLDMPDKAIEYANKLIENDYDKGDGKRLIKNANRLKERFVTNETNTRHFVVVTADNSTQSQGGGYDDAAVEGAGSSQNYLETILTTADNKTVEGKIMVELAEGISADSLDLTDYLYSSVKIMTLTEAEEIEELTFTPKDAVTFKVNNITYASLKYKPAKEKKVTTGSVVDASGAENIFAKVLYTSEKLSLYSFKDELIFKKVGVDIAQSTASMVWTIGFKKKLAKLAANCPTLAAKAAEGKFSNNEASLIAFAKEYAENCK